MKRVLVNPQMIANLTWNKGYGNKILHLLFVINLAERLKRTFQMPNIDILDEFFALETFKTNDTKGQNIYSEKSAFAEKKLYKALYKYWKLNISSFEDLELEECITKSKKQFLEDMEFLKNSSSEDSLFVEGHFWHYDLMPTLPLFNKTLSINELNLKDINSKYPDLQKDNHIAVHLRDTDFNTHLRTIFNKGICLPNSYYEKAITMARDKLGKDVVFHLFSDNMDRLENIFRETKYIIHRDSAHLDWLSIFLSKNVIQSNSSFCWTASLFKTGLSIQPKAGYNWARPLVGSVPYGFEMPFSSMINCSEY
ncbi:MAG: hypothetical protein ACI9IP_000949 [Arcticibacterium sp.]|jgi:hypothetical protein